jgi:hypothetical protein
MPVADQVDGVDHDPERRLTDNRSRTDAGPVLARPWRAGAIPHCELAPILI